MIYVPVEIEQEANLWKDDGGCMAGFVPMNHAFNEPLKVALFFLSLKLSSSPPPRKRWRKLGDYFLSYC